MYAEWPARVPGAIIWQRTIPTGGPIAPVLPDGCVDLLWADGSVLIAGPDTMAHVPRASPGASYAGVRFAPGTGPAILGVRAVEIRDRRVPIADVLSPAQVRCLTERLDTAADPARALDHVAAEWHRETASPDRAVTAIVSGLRQGSTIAATADATGLGERALHRLCLTSFGYGPKTLARILRLQRALNLARTGIPFATVAVAAGYADQAHLARDVKALTGAPLRTVLASAP